MNHEQKFNNYTIYNKNEKLPKKINVFIVDIKNRALVNTDISDFIELSFIKKNNIQKYQFEEIKNKSNIKKQIILFSVDEDIKEDNKPFLFNGLEIFSNCLIYTYISYEFDARKTKLTYNEVIDMITF